ncbi:MAG: hypothetical protein P8Z00_07665, partial [Anaerolineales bacterium]
MSSRSDYLQGVRFRLSRLDGYARRMLYCLVSLMTAGLVVGTGIDQPLARQPLALKGQQATPSEPIAVLKPERVIGHGTLDDLDWSPDGGKLAMASSLGLYLYDPLSLKEVDRVNSANWIRWVNFNRRGDKLATVDRDGSVSVWILENRPYPILRASLLVSAGLPIRTLAFRDDLSVLAVGYGEASVELFDLDRDQIIARINLPDYPDTRQIEALAFSPDGKQLAVDSGYNIFLIDASSGAIKRILPSDHDIHQLTFSPAGPWLAADNAIYNLKDGSRVQTFRTFNPADIQAIAYSPDGQVLAITTGSTISLVDVDTGLVLQELVANGVNIRCLKFDPAGRKVVAATDDDRLWVWEVITGDVLQTTDAFTGPILDVDFSPDGNRFAAMSSDHIWL